MQLGGGAAHLAGATALTKLSLPGCDVTDAAVAAFARRLPRLKQLAMLYNDMVTDAGMDAIAASGAADTAKGAVRVGPSQRC